MNGDQKRRETAIAILSMRKIRCQIFPAEIFDEHAWTMLLQLFVSLADNETMTEQRLIGLAGTTLRSGRRWIEHLVIDNQIATRSDGHDVMLTLDAIDRMRRFLNTIAIDVRASGTSA